MSILVALSGGIDSAVVLASELEQGQQTQGVFFSYGSRHNDRERLAAQKIAKHYGIELFDVDLLGVGDQLTSSLFDRGQEVPKGDYRDEQMASTVVPARNMIMISVLAGMAESHKCSEIYIGVQDGSHSMYPDCRPNFINTMRQAVAFGTGGKVRLYTPLLAWTKPRILYEAVRLNVPLQLTYSCYLGQEKPCGECGACSKRKEAFESIVQKDPSYE